LNPFLQRALDLAQLAGNATASNPKVGAVLVQSGCIIGEGYHRRFGGPHAEVEAIRSAPESTDFSHTTLYVTLEPCCITGKTPPCTNLIIEKEIPRVVVGVVDPNPAVAGKGIAQLQAAGVKVEMAPDPSPFIDLNRAFWVNQQLKRPYVLLKWAQYTNGIMGDSQKRLHISGPTAQRYVHYLRSQYPAILIGENTLRLDDPLLTQRYFNGQQPLRVIFSPQGLITANSELLSDLSPVLVVCQEVGPRLPNVQYHIHPQKPYHLSSLLKQLYVDFGISGILVEGGSYTLQQFIDQNLFDEVQVITSPIKGMGSIASPTLPTHFYFDAIQPLGSDMRYIRQIQR
jgi:diaminohydroxyphosphoribosylaminopyrimidine deaminase / 5-amino-6-(5-phosphoribosylamino)uracil reductase